MALTCAEASSNLVDQDFDTLMKHEEKGLSVNDAIDKTLKAVNVERTKLARMIAKEGGKVPAYVFGEPQQNQEKLQDFGEVLEGAKKHTYALTKALDADIDIAVAPLSKSFPQPDYEKLIADGLDPRMAVVIAQTRAEIGKKPRKYGKQAWADKVATLRVTASDIISGKITHEEFFGKIDKKYNKSGFDYMTQVRDIAELGTEVLPSQIKGLESFKLAKMSFTIFNGEKNVSKWTVTDTSKSAGMGGMSNQKHLDTKEEALAYIKSQATSVNEKTGRAQTKFDIWTERGKAGTFLGKKVASRKYIELNHFDTLAEARAYRDAHNAELTTLLAEKKKVRAIRRIDNNPRVGEDYRNGKDVTPELFSSTLGFRGVQFGNWVEGSKRQQDLNNAYDGLMDLANLLGIPPKAISLNGTLGLAFGARGRGGKNSAMAHFEPGSVNINLTKKSGAGSLAHEWFHALDNYFGTMDKADLYMSEHTRPKRINDRVKQRFRLSTPEDFKVRQEVYEAWKSLSEVINKETKLAERSSELDTTRSKDYWSTVREMTARSFERYVIDNLAKSDNQSDYLANVVSEEAHNASNEMFGSEQAYPYPLDSEMEAVNKAYDNLFNTLETKETEQGTALYSKGKGDGISKSAIKTIIESDPLLNQMDDKIKIAGKVDDLPLSDDNKEKLDGSEEAVYINGTTYLIAENLDKDSVISVAWHEITHNALDVEGDTFIDETVRAKLFSRLDNQIKLNKRDKSLANAVRRTKQARTSEDNRLNEVSAYLVTDYLGGVEQSAPVTRWVKEFIAAIKAAIIKYTGITWGMKVDGALMNAIAKSYADYYIKSKSEVYGNEVALASKQSITGRWNRLVESLSSKKDDFTLSLPTSPALKLMGINSESLSITKRILTKIARKHKNLTSDAVMNMPEHLGNPKYIYSHGDGGVNAVVFDVKGKNGEPVIVGVRGDKITTILAKEGDGDRSIARKVMAAIASGEKVYIANEKALTEAKALAGETETNPPVRLQLKNIITEKDTHSQPLFSKADNRKNWENARGTKGLSEAQFNALGKSGRPDGAPLKDKVAAEFKKAKERWSVKFRQGVLDQYESVKSILGDRKSWMLMQLAGSAGGAVEMSLVAGQPYRHKDGVLAINEKKKGLADIFETLRDEGQIFLSWLAGNRAEQINNRAQAAEDKIAILKSEVAALKAQANEQEATTITIEGRADNKGLRKEAKRKEAEIKKLQQVADVKERLFSAEDIKSLKDLNKNKRSDGSVWAEREAVYEQARKDFEELHNAFVQIGVDTGLVSSEDAQIWREQGFYVPFYRIADDEKDNQYGAPSVSGMVGQTAYKKMKGADIQLDDLLLNTVMNWEHLATASLKNQAAQSALDSAVKMGLATKLKSKSASKKRKGTKDVFVRVNGKEVWYTLDDSTDGKLVLQSISSLTYSGLNGSAMKVARKFKRALTYGVTASPEFKIANLIRDSIQAIAVGDMSVNVAKNIKQGWAATHKLGSKNVQAIAGGGLFGDSGYIHGNDPDAIAILMADKIKDENLLNTELKLKKWWNKYQDLGARLENVNRQANIEQKLAKGDNRLESLFAGRDHLDFQRSGAFEAVKFLTQVTPFLNARMQGLDKMYRALEDPKQRAQMATVITMYSLASVLVYLWMKDDEDYKEAEDWERDTYHLIKLPGTDVMVRIPRPFEVGFVASMIERGVEQFADPDVEAGVFFERLRHGITETLSFNLPQIISPALDIRANKSSFTGRQIESMSMQRLSPANRKKPWTSQTAIGLSNAMSVLSPEGALSPIQIDYLVQNHLGWAGATVLEAVDLLARPMAGAPAKPSMQLKDYPVIGRFVRDAKGNNAKQITQLYDNRGYINRMFSDIEQYKANGEISKYRAEMKSNKVNLDMRKQYNKASMKITKIGNQITRVVKGNLSPEAKRDRINRLNRQRIEIAKRVLAKTKMTR